MWSAPGVGAPGAPTSGAAAVVAPPSGVTGGPVPAHREAGPAVPRGGAMTSR